MTAEQLIEQVRQQLKAAGETAWQQYPLPTDFLCFKSAALAAQNALAVVAQGRWLVMRDAALGPMREAVLAAGRQLIVPTSGGREFLSIPYSGPSSPLGGRSVLRLSHLPPEAAPYRGGVDVVVVGCHAFEAGRQRVMALDSCRTEGRLEDWRDGLPDGWRLGSVLVIALAADAQQVSGWPEWAEGHPADVVITPTRVVALRTGEQEWVDDLRTLSAQVEGGGSEEARNSSAQDLQHRTPVARDVVRCAGS